MPSVNFYGRPRIQDGVLHGHALSVNYCIYPEGQVKKWYRRALTGWPPEILSIDILNQDLGGQIQDDRQ